MLAVYSGVTYWRAHLEEQVLFETFSEYRQYRQQAGCFLPRLSKAGLSTFSGAEAQENVIPAAISKAAQR
jgi:hypothetical protein